MPLAHYHAKRDFKLTPEPRGRLGAKKVKARAYLIQKHAASHLHYDFRLELNGVLLSWAVPKGPSLDPADKRLAMHVEDHPLEYRGFEGTIPKGQYGGGTVMLWDRGTWSPIGDAEEGFRRGHLKFELNGEKLQGRWALIKTHGSKYGGKGEPWLLIKDTDAAPATIKVPQPAKPKPVPAQSDTVAGVKLSHPDKLLFPEAKLTKLALARYCAAIAEWIKKRCVRSQRFFHVLCCPREGLVHRLGIERPDVPTDSSFSLRAA